MAMQPPESDLKPVLQAQTREAHSELAILVEQSSDCVHASPSAVQRKTSKEMRVNKVLLSLFDNIYFELSPNSVFVNQLISNTVL